MWLRLVQSARDRDEQNLEAYVKNGQLFYRSLRRIEKDEELLVWYGKDLIELLLLSAGKEPVKAKGELVTWLNSVPGLHGFSISVGCFVVSVLIIIHQQNNSNSLIAHIQFQFKVI